MAHYMYLYNLYRLKSAKSHHFANLAGRVLVYSKCKQHMAKKRYVYMIFVYNPKKYGNLYILAWHNIYHNILLSNTMVRHWALLVGAVELPHEGVKCLNFPLHTQKKTLMA